MMNITETQKRFWSPLVRELEPYIPGEQPKIANLLKVFMKSSSKLICAIFLIANLPKTDYLSNLEWAQRKSQILQVFRTTI